MTRAENRGFCERAIAYLRQSVPEGEPAIRLPEADTPVLRNLKNGLLVAYLVDQGEHFAYVQQRHLQAAGLTEIELHEQAIKNLAALLDTSPPRIEPYENAFQVLVDGNFEASLILVDSLWDQHLNHLAPSGFMVAIPNRDILVFCDARSAAGVDTLRQVIARTAGGSHPIAETLYRRDPAKRAWQPYTN